ncbi:MAG: HlyD family efflux transporter periplasmic adaptor subunit [Novosphingobium sp.]
MFRAEIIDYRKDRLSGDISVAVPVSWQGIGFLTFVGIAASLAFLSLASYSRTETVSGIITPDTGASIILPTRVGVIAGLAIQDGQSVIAGAELATVRVEEDGAFGVSPSGMVEQAIARQDASLAAQAEAVGSSARAQLAQIEAQRSGLVVEIAQLQSQIALQRGLIASAQRDFDRAGKVAERGFISQRDLQAREETLQLRQQGLAQLIQALAAKQAALSEAERNAQQIAAQSRAQHSSLSATRAQVAQQAASTVGSRSYVLRAPVAGRVTALTARIGQSASPQIPLMTIVPTGSTLRAELVVPTSAIGFVKVGQEVRLAIDAFPYQRFGSVNGRVVTVASSSVNVQGANGASSPVYPVTVALDAPSVQAFGRSEPLISGMTLSARIITEKQTLLQWLFEPLYAVARR